MSCIFNKLRVLLTDNFQFHYQQIQPETKFELELGMDSREMIELLDECEETFHIKINWDDIDLLISEGNLIVIQDLVNYIEKKIDSTHQF